MHLLEGKTAVALAMGLSFFSVSFSFTPVLANHEVINVDWQGGVYVHGNPFRTTVEIERGSNMTSHDSSSNQTRYLIVFKDRIISQDEIPVQVHNETRTVTPSNTNRTAVYARPLTEGYWALSVEVYDMLTMQRLDVDNAEKTIVVQPAIYEVLRQLSDAAKANQFWTQLGLVIAVLGAIGAAFGGATIGAYFSRKAAAELVQETKKHVNGADSKIVPSDPLEVSRDVASLQEQTAQSQRSAAEALQRTAELQVLLDLFKTLGDVELSKARGRIYVVYCSVYGSDASETRQKQEQLLRFYANIRDDIRKVEAAFDQAGVLVMNDKVDRKLFFDLYAPVVVRTFKALEVHIKHEQVRSASYGTWYAKLYEAALDYYRTELKSTPPAIYCRGASS